MIMCSCNVLSDKDLKTCIREFCRDNPGRRVTPGCLYKKLGCSPKCKCCIPLAIEAILKEGGPLHPAYQDGTKSNRNTVSVEA